MYFGGSHCDHLPWAPKNLVMPLFIITAFCGPHDQKMPIFMY